MHGPLGEQFEYCRANVAATASAATPATARPETTTHAESSARVETDGKDRDGYEATNTATATFRVLLTELFAKLLAQRTVSVPNLAPLVL